MDDNKEEFNKIDEEAKKDIKEEIKEDVLSEIPEKTQADKSAGPRKALGFSREPEVPAFKKPVFPVVKPPMPNINWWAMGALAFFLLFVASIFTGGFSGITGMSAIDVGDDAVTFLNDQLLPPGTEATLISTESVSGVYKLRLDIAGEQYDSFATKDGNWFFISGIELTMPLPAMPEPVAEEMPVVEEEVMEEDILIEMPEPAEKITNETDELTNETTTEDNETVENTTEDNQTAE